MNVSERTCLWTYERMLLKTVPYCVPVYFIDIMGKLVFDGYYMSELAKDNILESASDN